MNGMVYQWRSGTRLPVDAQLAGETIERLRQKANGQLTPTQVVDASRADKAPLHPCFEWDDNVAAERFREDQARGLIGALVVTVRPKGVEREVRAFVSVQRKSEERGYTALHAALSDAELRRQVVSQAWDELRRWRAKYEAYSELAAVFAAIDAGQPKGLAVG